jgi:hypothetical protein
MIFGKIDPVATIVTKSTPFAQITVTGSYIAAMATPYTLGADKVTFQVMYGDCTFDTGSGAVSRFRSIYKGNISVSGSIIDDWGTDDNALLSAIATLQGTTVTEIVSGSIRGSF